MHWNNTQVKQYTRWQQERSQWVRIKTESVIVLDKHTTVWVFCGATKDQNAFKDPIPSAYLYRDISFYRPQVMMQFDEVIPEIKKTNNFANRR